MALRFHPPAPGSNLDNTELSLAMNFQAQRSEKQTRCLSMLTAEPPQNLGRLGNLLNWFFKANLKVHQTFPYLNYVFDTTAVSSSFPQSPNACTGISFALKSILAPKDRSLFKTDFGLPGKKVGSKQLEWKRATNDFLRGSDLKKCALTFSSAQGFFANTEEGKKIGARFRKPWNLCQWQQMQIAHWRVFAIEASFKSGCILQNLKYWFPEENKNITPLWDSRLTHAHDIPFFNVPLPIFDFVRVSAMVSLGSINQLDKLISK